MNFQCEECGSDCIREFIGGCSQATEIMDVQKHADGSIDILYGNAETFYGDEPTYECGFCGLSIPNVSTDEELYEFLELGGEA